MTVIAISRKVGSLGGEIADLVAKEFSYQLADGDMIHKLAESCDPEFKDACALYEREAPKRFWERFFLNDPAYASLFESLNFELAAKGNVVILGRGSQIVLGKVPDVLKVRVVAPAEVRAKRVADREGMPMVEAEEFVERFGHQRRALIQQIYHVDLSDWSLYDVVLNTGDLSAKTAAAAIIEIVKHMPPLENDAALREELKRKSFAKLVESAIRKKVFASVYRNVDVECPEPGKVILSGFVPEKEDLKRAEKIAKDFKGVTDVENKIRSTSLQF